MDREQEQRELVRRCIKRDRRAQNLFYQTHFAYMMRIALRYATNREQALEWVNLGFAKIFLGLKKYDTARPLGTWMGKVLTNVILDELRKEKRHVGVVVEADVSEMPRAAVDEEPLGQSEELREMVESELARLPATTRRVFQLYAFEGYKHKEISELLRIPEGTSHWHYSSAKKHLKQALQAEWLQHHPS